MNNLTTLCNRMTAMLEDYNARTKNAAERIVTLGNDLQTAKDAMNAAAAADDPTAYLDAEARVRFLTARIEAAKREQVDPMFASLEEADALAREYDASVKNAIRPIYERLQATIEEQKALLEELRAVKKVAGNPMFRMREHLFMAGRPANPFEPSRLLVKYIEDGSRDAMKAMEHVLKG